MATHPLHSLAAYSRFVAELLDRSTVERSTVSVWFRHGFRLRMREEIDFDEGLITAYGYEVYQGQEKI